MFSDIPCLLFHKPVDGGGRRSITLHTALISGEGDYNLGRNWRRLAFISSKAVPSDKSFSLHEVMRDIPGSTTHRVAIYLAHSSIGEAEMGFGGLSCWMNLWILYTRSAHLWMYIGDYSVFLRYL